MSTHIFSHNDAHFSYSRPGSKPLLSPAEMGLLMYFCHIKYLLMLYSTRHFTTTPNFLELWKIYPCFFRNVNRNQCYSYWSATPYCACPCQRSVVQSSTKNAPSNPRKNTILMDFLVYGNRKCLWIRCMFGYCPTLITIARVNCILGLMQMLMADCFSYVF